MYMYIYIYIYMYIYIYIQSEVQVLHRRSYRNDCEIFAKNKICLKI